MYDVYITKIKIDKVRHLNGIEIPLSNEQRRNIVLTGKNGSGKTSLLRSLSDYLDQLAHYYERRASELQIFGFFQEAISGAELLRILNKLNQYFDYQTFTYELDSRNYLYEQIYHVFSKNPRTRTEILKIFNSAITIKPLEQTGSINNSYKDIYLHNYANRTIADCVESLLMVEDQLSRVGEGIQLAFSIPFFSFETNFQNGNFILAFYEANRVFEATNPKHIEKVVLKDHYEIAESPRSEFLKYLLDLKITEALSIVSGKKDKAKSIHTWFENFEKLLKRIFEDDTVYIEFDESTFTLTLHQQDRESFDFNTLSDGYAAILDIVVDLILRMEKQAGGKFCFDMPGIVLIDEIETHLHLNLQKNILGFLEGLFPNIQFIVTTHSPFILNSAKNAIVFDLENHTLVQDGLTNLPYAGIVKGYFEVDDLSQELRQKFNRYKELVSKKVLTDDDLEEIVGLETYLDEIPDYLALDITTEYRKLKAQFESREDLDG